MADLQKQISNLNRKINAGDDSCSDLKEEVIRLRGVLQAVRDDMAAQLNEKDNLVAKLNYDIKL